jgi:hypothetical protein
LKKTTAQWTQGALMAVALAQGAQSLVAISYWNALNKWKNGNQSLEKVVSAENIYNVVVTLNRLAWVAGFVFLVVWLANVHTTTTSLLPEEKSRQYTRNWTIGVWFIPFVNLIGPAMVIAENQKIAYADRKANKVDSSWTSVPIKPNLVWWWLLVIGGLVTTQVGGLTIADATASTSAYMTAVMVVIIGSALTAIGILVGGEFITEMNEKLTA